MTGYTAWWGSVAGMFAWLTLGLGLTAAAGHRRTARKRVSWPPRERSPSLAVTGLGMVAVIAIGAAVATSQPSERNQWAFDAARNSADRLVDKLDRSRAILVTGRTSNTNIQVLPALMYELRHRDVDVVVGPGWSRAMGPHYDGARQRHSETLVLTEGPSVAPGSGRIVARVPLPDSPLPEGERVLTLTLRPAQG